jgi:hypothetical protein
MNAFLSTAILLAGLTQASSGPVIVSGNSQAYTPSTGWVSSPSASNAPVVASTVSVSGDNLIGTPLSVSQEYAHANVLVVPTPDLPPARVADLTQDLSVMCRIFGTSVPFTASGKPPVRPVRDDVFYGIVLGPMTRGAQALYLDGYGALFFLNVDYPLAPTEAQEQAQTQTPEPADPVWARTVREMSGQAEEEPQTARNAPMYSAQRVEDLRQAIIKTLVHGSNIRMRPQDVITLVVGELDNKRSNFRVLPTIRFDLATTGFVAATASRSQPATRSPAATLLILHVAKADVDAFAKNQLTLEQFTKKVQALFSSSVANAREPTPAGTRR